MENRKFQVGDKIKFHNRACVVVSLPTTTKTGVVEHLEYGGWSRDEYVPKNYEPVGNNTYWFLNEEEIGDVELLAPAQEKKEKKSRACFLLCHTGSNIVEEFATLPDVRKRVKEMLGERSTKHLNIKVYELKRELKVKVEERISIAAK